MLQMRFFTGGGLATKKSRSIQYEITLEDNEHDQDQSRACGK